jgi:homoserine kinase type II
VALLTRLSLSAAQPLARAFGLDLASVEPLAAGSVNSNFRFVTSDGRRWFARIYEEQALDGARTEVRLVSCLARAGVPVVQSLTAASGEAVLDIDGKPFSIFPWLDGEILCQRRVTAGACEQVGAALARVHLATSSVGELSEGRFRPADLRLRLARLSGAERAQFAAEIDRILERLSHYEAVRPLDIPRGVIHSDLFRDNVLWENGGIAALLDFESACSGSFAYDVMTTVLAWCYGQDFVPELVAALLRGYSGVRRMPPAELAALRVEGAIACLRFATTRITDFSLRAPPGQPPQRDFRRFLARLEALETGALDVHFDSLRS